MIEMFSSVELIAEKVNLHPVFGALSSLFVAWITYYGFRRFIISRKHRINIERLQRSFEISKNVLKEKLAANSDTWKQISSLSFKTLRERLASGELKASDVLSAFQWKAINCSDRNNCITELLQNSSDIARNLDSCPQSEKRPLQGIPVSVKNNYIIPGTEATGGHASYIGKFSDLKKAAIVEFLEWTGAVPFCKTNIPQAMYTFDSENALHGTTSNPYDVTRGPGGSSSGEGALIGGGGSILGLGNDIGGSLRIPAAWSGCLTLKPTSQRFLNEGLCPGERYPQVMLKELLTNGFIARDVYTLTYLHRLLYSHATFERFPFETMVPVPFNDEMFSSEKKLRIAYYDCDGVAETVPAMKRAIRETRTALAIKGHDLVEWIPPEADLSLLFLMESLAIDGSKQLLAAFDNDIEIAASNKEHYLSLRLPCWLRYVVSVFYKGYPRKTIRALRAAGCPDEMNDLYRRIRDFRRRFAKAFMDNKFDAILCPAFACPALPFRYIGHSFGAASYTTLFNVLNWPAGVLPVAKVSVSDQHAMKDYPGNRDMFHRNIKAGLLTDSVGLPIAVQVAAPPFREEQVLRLMTEIESMTKFQLI